MRFDIECPKCGRHYAVNEKVIATKVRCSNANCGEIFIATEKITSPKEPEATPASEEFHVWFEERPGPPPVEKSTNKKMDDNPFEHNPRFEKSLESFSKVDQFHHLSRIVMGVGFGLLVCGVFCPSTVRDFPGTDAYFNLPLAFTKLYSILIALGFIILGGTLLIRSQSPLSRSDGLFIKAVVGGLAVIILLSMVMSGALSRYVMYNGDSPPIFNRIR